MPVDPIRIRSHGHFVRETRVPGAVFRGQVKDYGNLKPALYRAEHHFDVDALAALATRYFLGSHKTTDKVQYRAGVYSAAYEDSLPSPFPRLPDFSKLYGGTSLDDEPFIPIRIEMPFERLALRIKAITDLAAAEELEEREHEDDKRNWESFGPEAEFLTLCEEPAYALARLQHYGVPTPALDVTFDPYIAAWFAAHHFTRSGDDAFYLPHDDDGVVFVLKPPDSHVGDLRRAKIVPLGGLRALRQRGGMLLGATREDPDLARYVVKLLVVPSRFLNPPLWHLRDSFRAHRFNQRYLFPDGKRDLFFGELMRLKSRGWDNELTRWVVSYVDPPE